MPIAHPPLTHELRFTQVSSGARIAWARSGRVGAPVLLRVAHWMTHVDYDLRSSLWQPLIEQLGRQLEVLRYDERGCGLSTADDVRLGLDASVEELEAVTTAYGAQKYALLGVSGGAGAKTLIIPPRPGQVGLSVQGGYADLMTQGRLGEDYGNGPVLAVRVRYRMRYERAFGLSFEGQRFDARSSAKL